ncbi:hypothetical protein I79_026123 [Cricetulus griseus]|uniref:Uncharacterized protein n=1 Tax=Cricetulus griseus TaxID=10029 RepID=G3IQ35_CRIGR|nr:hypothetical protein I79_026123 [Cricetulus griseus]
MGTLRTLILKGILNLQVLSGVVVANSMQSSCDVFQCLNPNKDMEIILEMILEQPLS